MKEYEVLSEDKNEVKIRCQNLTYTVGLKDNSLIRLSSSSQHWVNAKIPHIFPSGHRIDSLLPYFVAGGNRFNKIIVSKGIQVETAAFEGANVHKVVWPEDCKVIPFCCFKNSNLEEIYNIQNVEEIKASAFECCHIQGLTWPDKCKTVPEKCFYGSRLRNIVNLNFVERVCKRAFAHTPVERLDFSGSDKIYLEESSLIYVLNTCKMILPYYMSQCDLAQARKIT